MSRVPFNFLDRCIALKKPIKQSLGENIHLDDKKKKRIYDWYSCILYNIYKESKKLLHGKQLFTDDPQSQWLNQFIETLKYKIENLKDLKDPTTLYDNMKYSIPKIPVRIDPFYWSMRIAIRRIIKECSENILAPKSAPLLHPYSSSPVQTSTDTKEIVDYSAPELLDDNSSLSPQDILQFQGNDLGYYFDQYKTLLDNSRTTQYKTKTNIQKDIKVPGFRLDRRRINILLDMLANADSYVQEIIKKNPGSQNLKKGWIWDRQFSVVKAFHNNLDAVRNYEDVRIALKKLQKDSNTDFFLRNEIEQIFQEIETSSIHLQSIITIFLFLIFL